MHLGTAERVQKGKPLTIQELGKITGTQDVKVLEEFGRKPGHYKYQMKKLSEGTGNFCSHNSFWQYLLQH